MTNNGFLRQGVSLRCILIFRRFVSKSLYELISEDLYRGSFISVLIDDNRLLLHSDCSFGLFELLSIFNIF